MTRTSQNYSDTSPELIPMGLDGFLVRFSGQLSEGANKASIAFHARLETEAPEGIVETSVALASVYLRYDPTRLSPDDIADWLGPILDQRDWYSAALPEHRTLWTVPTVFDPQLALQIEEVATLAGGTIDDVMRDITRDPLRVLALGFAPGQPYLGTLPERWNLPRQTTLNKCIPSGALALAVRQMVLFTTDAPTGWRHVGQTAFRNFRPEHDQPFALKPGDEIQFRSVSPEELEDLRATDPSGMGGATSRSLD